MREFCGSVDATFQLILARVVVGWSGKRAKISSRKELMLIKNREPPEGCQSVTSEDAPGCEIVVFPGNLGVPVYPAYVITYRSPLNKDLYRDLTLLRMSFSNRETAHVFNYYKKHFRQGWSCQREAPGIGNPQDGPPARWPGGPPGASDPRSTGSGRRAGSAAALAVQQPPQPIGWASSNLDVLRSRS